jgi:hypothetical protein
MGMRVPIIEAIGGACAVIVTALASFCGKRQAQL